MTFNEVMKKIAALRDSGQLSPEQLDRLREIELSVKTTCSHCNAGDYSDFESIIDGVLVQLY